MSYDCWYGVKGPPRVRGGLPFNLPFIATLALAAPRTRGFTPEQPARPPKHPPAPYKQSVSQLMFVCVV